MKVNYLIEINRLNRWEMTHPLKPTAFKLMLKLLDLANTEEFPEEIRVSTNLLTALVGCSESALLRARDQLIETGRLVCRANRGEAAIYALNYFSLRNPAFIAGQGEERAAADDHAADGTSDGSCEGSSDGTSEGTSDGSPEGTSGGENRVYANFEAVPSNIYKTKPNQTRPKQTEEEIYPTIEEGRARGGGDGKDARLRGMAAYVVNTHPAFAAERDAFMALVNNRRYSARLLMEALDRTEKRHEREPLESPRAYFVALLADYANRAAVRLPLAARPDSGV